MKKREYTILEIYKTEIPNNCTMCGIKAIKQLL